ncbi:hypothetical protein Tco_0439796 [Tanacetum coccineum]
MPSGGSDQDTKDALSKLLQIDSLLISFYISGLKLNLQHELLVSRPTTLGDAFSLARITEARFEAIAEKEQNIKEKADTTLAIQLKKFTTCVKGPLDAMKISSSLCKMKTQILRSNENGLNMFVASLPNFSKIREVWKRYVLSATKLPEGGNSQSSYSPYHLEGKVNFEGVGNVTPMAANVGRRKRVKCYIQGSERRKRKKGIDRGSGRQDCAIFGASIFALLNLGPGSFAHRRIWDPGINFLKTSP